VNVIGIDPSLTATGWADADGNTGTTGGEGDGRLQWIFRIPRHLIADLAVVEDLPTHGMGAGKTGMAQGVVRLALIQAHVPYILVAPATVKKFITGRGNATKADIRMAIYQRVGLDFPDDNQADAWVLRQIGLHLLHEADAIPLPKTHLLALDKVKLPDAMAVPS
jgi:Holliday junction resolvasome RuvABC endonuclease subunit